jgi:hypothetical protein
LATICGDCESIGAPAGNGVLHGFLGANGVVQSVGAGGPVSDVVAVDPLEALDPGEAGWPVATGDEALPRDETERRSTRGYEVNRTAKVAAPADAERKRRAVRRPVRGSIDVAVTASTASPLTVMTYDAEVAKWGWWEATT